MTVLNLENELIMYQKKYNALKIIESIVMSQGYLWVEPSTFEDYDEFRAINQRVSSEGLLKLIDPRSKVLVVSPDITTGLMQSILPKYKRKSPLKLFYYTNVYSIARNAHIIETKQFGVENLGDDSNDADGKVFTLALSILEAFEIDYVVELNHSELIERLLESHNVSSNDKKSIKEMLYYKRQEQLKNFLKSRQYQPLYPLVDFIHFQGDLNTFASKWQSFTKSSMMDDILETLSLFDQNIPKMLKAKLTYDGSLISLYDYYEGMTFKCFSKRTGRLLLQGGRYDKLTETFGMKIPAIGFSLNMADLMEEMNNE